MPLPPGSRIADYEIVAPLGAGGMGEVYRARDLTLGREVAIKVVSPEFSSDPSRQARLEREARVLATLNHTHIGAIYGLVQSDAGPALVLELVEGPTLQQRIAEAPLPLPVALGFARQIADALEAAHEQGIVHRDLKPSNIKIRPDGAIKVLDFGIAKMLDREGDNETGDHPTVSATGRGVLVGTPAYMSPEQTRGLNVTRRSDVWAFGAILYEMLSGRRAFAGHTTSDVVASILRGTPDFTALPATTPPSLVRLLKRCLERETAARLRDIGDARLEIEDVERSIAGDAPPAAAAHTVAPSPGPARMALIATSVVVLAAIAYLAWPRGAPVMHQEMRLQMAPPAGMRFVSVPAFSLDGRRIAFAAVPSSGGDARLFVKSLADIEAKELPETAGATYPFWSPDGRFIGFFAGGVMKRVSVASGNPVIVCEASPGRGGLWLEGDTIAFAPSTFGPLMRVSAGGGRPEPFTTITGEDISHRFPARLPGGRLMYYVVTKTPQNSGTRIVAEASPDRQISFITTSGSAEFVNGYLIFVRAPPGQHPLLAQPLRLDNGELTGEPIEIGRTRISETLGRHVFTTAPTGVIANLGPVDGVGQFTWMSRDGRTLDTVGEPAMQLGVELSPDGKQVATYRAGEVWTLNLARPVASRVTSGNGSRHAFWSPDGLAILTTFQGRGIATFDLVATSVATGEIETIGQFVNMVKTVAWMKDGRMAWIESNPSGTGTRVVTRSAGGKGATVFSEATRTEEARVSPDGRWIAYATDRSGRIEVEVRSFPDPGPRYPVSSEGGGYPRWRADGRELYFLSAAGRIMAASFTAAPAPVIGVPAVLFEVALIAHPDRGNFAEYEYDVNSDGTRFLVNRMVTPPQTSLSVTVDWNPPRP